MMYIKKMNNIQEIKRIAACLEDPSVKREYILELATIIWDNFETSSKEQKSEMLLEVEDMLEDEIKKITWN